MEIRRVNGKKEYYYEITGKIPLTSFLREKRFSLEELRKILRRLLELEDVLEEYLLEGSGLLVNDNFLFVDRTSGSLEGIYHGGKTDGDVSAFGALLEIVMESMNQKDRELVFFVYGMHKLTRSAGCTRAELKHYLAEGGENEDEKENESETGKEEGENRVRMQNKRELRNRGNRESLHPHPEKQGTYLFSVLILAAGFFILFIMWRRGTFTMPLSGGIDVTKGIGATAFFLVVCGYGAWRALPARGNREFVRKEQDLVNCRICLIPKQSGDELVPVKQFPVLIGNDESRTDICLGGSGVSGIHLEIFREAGEVYASDQESSAGTYLNGSRLVPWQKSRLRDGDILAVGVHEYVVELTSSEYDM